MANDEYRPQLEAARRLGLEVRQGLRHRRAIRREVAEEIALAIEAHELADSIWHGQHIRECAAIARSFATPDASERLSGPEGTPVDPQDPEAVSKRDPEEAP